MSQAEVPPEDLAQSVALLTALRDPARPDHTLAMSSLDEHVSNPSFVLVMLHVFANQHAAPCDLRQLAGLIIKNYVFPHLARLPGQVQAALKGRVVQVLQDAEPAIRNTAAILVGKISDSFPVATWSDMLPPILAHLDISQYVQNPIGVEGALAAVQRICEDSALKLGLDEVNRPLDLLIPRLLGLLSCPDKGIRSAALSSYNSLLYLLSSRGQGMGTGGGSPLRSRNSSDNDEEGMGQGGQGQGGQEGWGQGQGGQGGQEGWGQGQGQGQGHSGSPSPSAAVPLLLHMRPFIEALSTLTSDQHAPVRKGVCQAITTIASLHVAALDPYFADICQFMLVALQDSEESVAIEGCEFWAVVLEQPDTKRAMLPALGALVQRLVQRLYLTSEQMESDRIDEEEEAAGEKELNLRPMHHRPSGGEGGELGDDAKENSELSAKWTLRKQAALLLDTVGISFPAQEVLSCALPTIQELFQSQDVLVRESGMLALGALSTGCLEAMLPHLGSIFPFLLQ
ncbi:armadillo-type protein, partial [Ochromonadaceae sp. CCMP2298]